MATQGTVQGATTTKRRSTHAHISLARRVPLAWSRATAASVGAAARVLLGGKRGVRQRELAREGAGEAHAHQELEESVGDAGELQQATNRSPESMAAGGDPAMLASSPV